MTCNLPSDSRAVGDFTPTSPNVRRLFTFDFVNTVVPGDSIDPAQITLTIGVMTGTDATPLSHLVGLPSLFGTKVTQECENFLAGVEYYMLCNVTTRAGLKPALWAPLKCEPIGC